MADVFISYQRGSDAMARRVAQRLREAGWDVWFDANLPPHRAYSEIIQEQLTAAKAVVVLWSDAGAKSEWVRAEADLARQHRKLVQASLDGVMPPMPFNQIQCATLKGWGGDEADPEWRKIAGAIVELAGSQPAMAAPAAAAAVRSGGGFGARRRLAVGAAFLLAVMIGGAAVLLHGRFPGTGQPRLLRAAILPFQVESPAPAARYFAEGLADQIQNGINNSRIQVVSRADAATLAGGDRDAKLEKLGVRLVFDGEVQDDGKTIDATVHLNDNRNHVTLWSGHFSGAVAQSDSLRAHIGAVIIGVLTCSERALRPGDGIADPQVLIQYLIACDRFAQQGENDAQMSEQMVSALRQVTQQAPEFSPAHAALAKFLAYTAAVTPPEQAAAKRSEADAEARRALQLDPKDADAYVALELLQPAANWTAREALLRKGLAADPDWPHANGFLGMVLAEVGRTQEAVTFTRRAAAADPLGESWAGESVQVLGGAGLGQEADAGAAQLARSWPDSVGDWLDRLLSHAQGDDWNGVIADLAEPVAGKSLPPVDLAALRTYSTAEMTRDPQQRAKARQILLRAAQESPAYRVSSISWLASLGYVDDAFKVAEAYEPGLALTGANTEFLFTVQTAPLRRDPRFMQLAARIGLLHYWRSTGKWPDFCRDPTLPYRCH